MSLISFFYNAVVIPVIRLIIILCLPFNKKLKERQLNWEKSLLSLSELADKNFSYRIWVHAASMGEFEQAKPVIEKLKNYIPNLCVIVSFYSPSGYLNQKTYKFADAVVYMPVDIKKKADIFINMMKPDLALFVRYDVWRNHLELLHKKNIPVYLINATVPNSSFMRFGLLVPFMRSNYNFYKKIFTVGQNHSEYFVNLEIDSEIFTVTDTRFDRIIESVENAKKAKLLPSELFENEFVLVAGSTWQPDEEVIFSAYNMLTEEEKSKLRLILVPHEPTSEHLENLRSKFPDSVYLSDLLKELENSDDLSSLKEKIKAKTIIVDSIGKLLKLYANATGAYIGGAFGVGVHSVTEPAGYGIPLVCGINMKNSPDALILADKSALKIVSHSLDLYIWLRLYLNSVELQNITGLIASIYIYNSVGSSEIIVQEILIELEEINEISN